MEAADKSLNQIVEESAERLSPKPLTKLKSQNLKNVDIKELYTRESLIQQEIFYYNNQVLPRVVSSLTGQSIDKVK